MALPRWAVSVCRQVSHSAVFSCSGSPLPHEADSGELCVARVDKGAWYFLSNLSSGRESSWEHRALMGGLGLASLSGLWDGCWPDHAQENLTEQ